MSGSIKKPFLLFILLWISLIILIVDGCNRHGTQNNIPLAKVGSKYLYEADMKEIIPKRATSKDSLIIAHSYINKWIHTQLLLIQAEKNLPPEKLNFDRQLEEYRNSLIIYRYETEYVKQRLDTLVSEKNIEDYYQGHLKDFELKENIVKVVYAILNKKRHKVNKLDQSFKKIFRLPDSLLLDSLERFAPTRAEAFSADTNTWLPFNEILKVIPIEAYNQELYLKNHRIIFIKGDIYDYLLKFVNFKIKDETSPLDLESRFIRSIIINKRKKLLINNLRKEIFDQASKRKEFEIY